MSTSMDPAKKPSKESESKSINVFVEAVNTSAEPAKTSAEPAKTSAEPVKASAEPSKSNEPLKNSKSKSSIGAEAEPAVETAFENTLSARVETEPGEFTDNLSDISNNERFDADHLRQRSFFVRCLRRFFPHFRNNLTLVLFIVNTLLAIGIVTLLLVNVTLVGVYFELKSNFEELKNKERLCVYTWTEWGPCSGTCQENGRVPFRTRKVINYTQGDPNHPCPVDILNWTDYAPCNTRGCPVPLTSFGWTVCRDGFRMRDLPMRDQLIEIDDGNLYETC